MRTKLLISTVRAKVKATDMVELQQHSTRGCDRIPASRIARTLPKSFPHWIFHLACAPSHAARRLVLPPALRQRCAPARPYAGFSAAKTERGIDWDSDPVPQAPSSGKPEIPNSARFLILDRLD